MKEEEIHAIPGVSHSLPFLAGHKREIVSKLQEKFFQTSNQGVFEIRFRILVFQIQELQHKRIANVRIRIQRLVPASQGSRPLGSLVGKRGNLPVELAHGPTALDGFAFIETAGLRVGN